MSISVIRFLILAISGNIPLALSLLFMFATAALLSSSPRFSFPAPILIDLSFLSAIAHALISAVGKLAVPLSLVRSQMEREWEEKS
jgi:hypothetical protein